MASPLDFSLAGLTPEQLKAQQDFQRTLGSQAGARAASARPFDWPQAMLDEDDARRAARSAAPSAAGETAAEATARRAAGAPGAAGARPSFTSGASFEGPRGAAPAAAAQPASLGQKAKNLYGRITGGGAAAAPQAAPAAAGPTSLGQKAVGLLKGGRSLVGKLGVYGAAAGAAINQFDPDATSRYATRFGVDEPANDGSVGSIAKDAALRLGGFGTDLANAATLGGFGRFYRDKPTGLPFSEASPEQLERPQTRAPAPAPAGAAGAATAVSQFPVGIATPARGTAAARAANRFLESRAVPESGTGIVRNDLTGNVTTINEPYQFPAFVGQQAPQPVQPVQPVQAPQLGTQGDIFSSMLQFQKDLGVASQGAAAGTLARRQGAAAQKAAVDERTFGAEQSKLAFDQDLKIADLRIQKQTADAATTTAAGRGQAKPQVIQGMPGEAPLIVDPTTGRATLAQIVPSFADFKKSVLTDERNKGYTDAQLRDQYAIEYQQ